MTADVPVLPVWRAVVYAMSRARYVKEDVLWRCLGEEIFDCTQLP